MKDHQTILHRVGWVLIIGGLIDIGFMVYCIANQTSYSSSFNIFAIIAGVFLLRGSLKAARIISWFMAFFIAAFTGMLIFLPLLFPFDLLVAYIRLATASVVAGIVVIPFLMAILVWIYRKLTSTAVREAMDQAELDHTSFWRKPAQLGDGYKFHVKYLNMSSGTGGKHVNAVITAYNADKIKDVVAEWSE